MTVREQDTDSSSAGSASEEVRKTPTPLPKLQLLVIFLIMLTEPLTAVVVFPFAPEFVRRTGITHGDEKKTGYYTGIIEAMSTVSEGISVYWWARASDRWGRRPILLIAPLALAVCISLFGLSTHFWQLVLFRALQGVFNGNIGVARTAMAEVTDETNINKAYSLMPLMWSSGMATGNAIGGLLSYPARKWPDTLGRIYLLVDHPFFLPCAVTAFVCVIAFCLAFVGLKETSTLKKPKTPAPETESLLSTTAPTYGTADTTVAAITPLEEPAQPPTLRELFAHKPFTQALAAYAFLSFADGGFDGLIPLVYNSSIANSGLGLRPSHIGAIMGSISVINTVFQLSCSARLLDRFGPPKVFVSGLLALIAAIACFPVESVLAKRAGEVDGAVWAVIGLQVVSIPVYSLCFAAIQVLLVQSAPTKAALAVTNSVGHMTACAARALSPWIATSIFSFSLQHQILDGYFVYVFLGVVVIGGVRVGLKLC